MITLRDASPSDIQGILDIINWAIENTNAYWRFSPETFNERQHWYESRLSEGRPVIVATDDTNQVIGFGSYGEFRSPPGNKGCVEHSVYVRHDAHGRGVGGKLLDDDVVVGDDDDDVLVLRRCLFSVQPTLGPSSFAPFAFFFVCVFVPPSCCSCNNKAAVPRPATPLCVPRLLCCFLCVCPPHAFTS